MLVTRGNFDSFLKELSGSPNQIGLDTETMGIFWWNTPRVPWYKPRVFSVQFSTLDGKDFYLDFNHSDNKLGDSEWVRLSKEVFADPEKYWFIQNAKFELHQLLNHDCPIAGEVHCTKSIARVMNNIETEMGLDALGAKYLNSPKLDVKTYIKENSLFTKVKREGLSETVEEWAHFDRLPLEMLVDYGQKDTQLCRDLGLLQLKKIAEIDSTLLANVPQKLTTVLKNENKLNKTVFQMERVGVQVDIPYTEKAFNNEREKYLGIKAELNVLANTNEIDWQSPDQIKKYFESKGEKSYKFTSKGKMSFDKEALEDMEAPEAKLILKYRYHYKRAHTYFENYLWLTDDKGVLHCDFQNGGTETGRQSCWNPNLQNVPKRRDKEESDFKVRRCFIPREGYFFADLDLQAAEYRMMLDYARETKLIEKVQAGHDVHDATKEELGIADRDTAKTINFALLYGQGVGSFARSLKKTQWEAKQLKARYFAKLPGVEQFIFGVRGKAQSRGFIVNWLGRILQYDTRGYPDGNTYKAPNGLIQSGVGDTLKVAANKLAEAQKGWQSRMVLLVHDATLFEIKYGEEGLIAIFKEIIRRAYPHKLLPMEVDGGYSAVSWSDLQDEIPHVS